MVNVPFTISNGANATVPEEPTAPLGKFLASKPFNSKDWVSTTT